MTQGAGSGHPLNEALAELRAAYAEEEPPARIEAFLLKRAQGRRRRRAAWMWSGLAAGVCAAVLVPAYFVPRNDGPPSEKRTQVAEARKPVVNVAPAGEATEPMRREPLAAPRHARRVLPAKRNATMPKASEAAEGLPFVVLPFAEPFAPSEQVDIYRVQLPRGALAVYGFSARIAAASESPVTADVAVGSDGVVRAVRFVR